MKVMVCTSSSSLLPGKPGKNDVDSKLSGRRKTRGRCVVGPAMTGGNPCIAPALAGAPSGTQRDLLALSYDSTDSCLVGGTNLWSCTIGGEYALEHINGAETAGGLAQKHASYSETLVAAAHTLVICPLASNMDHLSTKWGPASVGTPAALPADLLRRG